ncbi:uncharacterized protein Dana_GF26883 [Drosophila ananassae]|uniref:Uncharacterized protein n=1 Tax=Drosophila ananassae TaxID=7217 RepID=A0A0P8ZQL5_DROAN|nr:uncharacterized protein Dana_GF26883 [Drosophila ananassae]
MLARLILLIGLLMLSWQWVIAMPPHSPGVPKGHPPLPTDNNTYFVQSILETHPNCRDGTHLTSNNRCRANA